MTAAVLPAHAVKLLTLLNVAAAQPSKRGREEAEDGGDEDWYGLAKKARLAAAGSSKSKTKQGDRKATQAALSSLAESGEL